jgi:hypothetical protein
MCPPSATGRGTMTDDKILAEMLVVQRRRSETLVGAMHRTPAGDDNIRDLCRDGGLTFQKRLPVDNRNGEIRPTEFRHHGKVNSYDLALDIEKRTARAARTGLGIIDNLAR